MSAGDRSAHDSTSRTGIGRDGSPEGKDIAYRQGEAEAEQADGPGPSSAPANRQGEAQAEQDDDPRPSDAPANMSDGTLGGAKSGDFSEQAGAPIDHNKRVADWTARLTVVTTVLAVLAACQFGAALLQWDAMRKQLNEMRSSTPDTKKLVQANQDLAIGMKIQAQNTGALVAQTGRSADAAMESLQAQERHFRSGERPIIDSVPCPAGIRFGLASDSNVVGWNYCYSNVGRTTATKIITTEYVAVRGSILRFVGNVLTPDVPPNEYGWHTIIAKGATANDVPDIVSKPNGLVAAVRWEYSDLEGNRYRSDVCWAYQPNGSVGACTLSKILGESGRRRPRK